MRIITSHRGLLQTLSEGETATTRRRTFTTGLPLLDGLLPNCGFALLLARSALLSDPDDEGGIVVWSDPAGDLYPPAVAAGGSAAGPAAAATPPPPAGSSPPPPATARRNGGRSN